MTDTPTPEAVIIARQAAFLLIQGKADQAAELCGRLREMDRILKHFSAFVDLLTLALPRERLYPLVRGLVDAGFSNARSLDLLAATAAWAGNRDAVRDIMDSGRFLSVERLHGADEPDLAPLAMELSTALDRYDQPDYRSIRMGWRRNHLEREDSPVIRRMIDRLWQAALRYIDRLPVDPDNPFTRSRPAGLCLRAWSVVSDAATYHVQHLHAASWINGVYYVVVPPIAVDTVGKPGWLRVGPAANRGFTADDGWDERWIRPEPGMAVIMPSHFSHGTTPLGIEGRRICVAFDLHAAREDKAEYRLPVVADR